MKVYGYIDAETHEYRQEASEEPPEMKICDFCCAPEIFKLYPNRETVALLPGILDSGGWAACQHCSELVDAEKWEELTRRSVDTFMEIYHFSKEDRPLIEAEMRNIHRGFRQNRGLVN